MPGGPARSKALPAIFLERMSSAITPQAFDRIENVRNERMREERKREEGGKGKKRPREGEERKRKEGGNKGRQKEKEMSE